MKTEKVQCCPECVSALVHDMQNGEIICSGCGMVVAEQLADSGPEAKGPEAEDRTRLARATGHTSYAQHDLGIATEISASNKDFSGKSITSGTASQMQSLRRWQQRVRVSSSKERRFATVLSRIGEICQGLGLSKNVRETSAMLYRNLDSRMDVKGRSITSISIAVIYIACKQCHVVRSIGEITAGACPASEVRSKTKLASRYYRSIVMEVDSIRMPVITLDKYISKLANLTRTDVRVERLALDLAEKTGGGTGTDGKAPKGIAAAYLYIASTLLNHGIMQRDISSVSEVTEVTIRNRCKDILGGHKIGIRLRPSLARR
jgi:transcription initiation factor TFIIB